MASVGPMFGQLGHFRNAAPEQIPYAITRYETETHRLLAVLDRQLATTPYIAGDYSIADIATYPWVMTATSPYMGQTLEKYSNVQSWVERMQARPAVQTGMAILTPEFDSQYGVVAESLVGARS